MVSCRAALPRVLTTGDTPWHPLGPPAVPRADFGTFGNKRARPAERGGAAGGRVAPQEGLRFVDEEAFLLRRRGLHGEDGRPGGLGAGAGHRAEPAGAHRQCQSVRFQLWEEEKEGKLGGMLRNGLTLKNRPQPTLGKQSPRSGGLLLPEDLLTLAPEVTLGRISSWHLAHQHLTGRRGLFARAGSAGTRGNGFKLKEGRFRSDARKKFFIIRMVSPWPRLPREAVAAPSLAVFKARLDGALSNLVWWKVSLLMAGGLDWMISKFPSNPSYSVTL